MSDEELHEIQLNGKQLVFLFMAATVVSVVIFLLGVMFGRGVRQAKVEAVAASVQSPVDPTASIQSSSSAAVSSSDRVPVTAQETLTYAERLEAPIPADDPIVEPPPAPKVEPPPAAKKEEPAPKKEQVVAAAAPAGEAARFSEPGGTGWSVQVAAYPRPAAEGLARSLAAKGYPTFITPRAGGLFAVRVGKYPERREADAMAHRLEQAEQFKKPWVIR
jgi:cell division septation protein DedD